MNTKVKKLALKRKKSRKHIESYFNFKPKKYTFFFKPNLNKNHSILQFNKPLGLGSFGLKYLGPTKYIETKSLKSCIRLFKLFFRKNKTPNLPFKINIVPDMVLTSKPKEVRMGKGKGRVNIEKVGIIKQGQTVLEISNIKTSNFFLLKKLLSTCSSKLPYKYSRITQF